MRIARFSIERPLYTWLVILFALFGGAFGYVSVGKLEDPAFTLKSALVVTPYPGASAAEVAAEVSEVIEAEVQQMDEIEEVTSRNAPGVSVIEVEVRDEFDGTELPQVWDDLRDRVSDAQSALPPGSRPSEVNDDFGDVFGILYAVSTEGFTDAETWEIATHMRRELLTVDGVANVEVRGLPEEAIFVEPSNRSLANLGIPPDVLLGAIGAVDGVVPTGTVSEGGRELRIDAPDPEDSVEEIGALAFGAQGETLNLVDVAEVSRGRVDEPDHILRHDGVEVFTLAVSGLTSENIVEVGGGVEARLDALEGALPLGVGIHPVYEQHRVVDEANDAFLRSLAISVSVVIGTLALFMGWRAGVVVGATLLLTVMATFFFMWLLDIKVERISLGALIIAMGMLVDNAIVVAEGMQTNMRRGSRAVDAAEDVARRTQIPLLGATVIGIMAFAGIGLSPDASGEFMFSLFAVIGLSLMLSWGLAVTVTPLLAHYLFRRGDGTEDAYGGRFFRLYGGLVRGAIRVRWLVILGLIGTTAACVMAFANVAQQFFPPASTPLFYFDYRAAQGTSIHRTSDDLAVVEEWLLERDDVVSVTTSVGQGMSRFLLTYNPEDPEPAYGQLVVRARDFDSIPPLRAELDLFVAEALPAGMTTSKRIIFGPPVGADVEARFSGPDPEVLRALAAEALTLLREETALLHSERIDWNAREWVTRPLYADDRGQALGITRSDVGQAIQLATDGVDAGTYREGDRLIDIVVRSPRVGDAPAIGAGDDPETQISDQIVYAPATDGYLPLAQVIDGFEVEARDTLIERRDRVPTISVQANVVEGVTPPTAFGEIRAAVEGIEVPPGYALQWGGDHEAAGEAQASLARQMPLSFGVMLLTTVLLFGKLRQTAVIWTVVPMAICGVSLGLLLTGLPFSFTALLGLLSLSGMLIKNAIVLVEEIDSQVEDGLEQREAIVTASKSRLRPVVLAAGTTILGMAPLLWDAFFASMAVAIMGGLGFASVLTLVGVPVLYRSFVAERRREGPARPEPLRLEDPVELPRPRQRRLAAE